MKIYLDLCVYNRPFDDQRQPRVAIETMECIFLLAKAISGEMALINSFALEFENGNNPFADRKDIIHELLSTATTFIEYDGALAQGQKSSKKSESMPWTLSIWRALKKLMRIFSLPVTIYW